MTFADLRALHAIIGQAIDQIEKVYKSENPPLEYPSLDSPYYSAQKHAHEVDRAEELKFTGAVFSAANQIVAACGQLVASVHKPFLQLEETIHGGNIVALLHFLEQSHIPEILRDAGPGGLSANSIAAEVEKLLVARSEAKPFHVDATKIAHILRFLATHHWGREVSPDVFANNRLTSLMDSGKSLEQLRAAPESKYDGSDGVAAVVATVGDEMNKVMAHFSEWLINGGLATNPENGSPLEKAFGTKLKYYEWLEQPGNEWRLARFGHMMNGTRQWEVAENDIDGFSWNDLRRDAVAVDVGGGIGSVSVRLSQAYPHLKFVVEDRPSVISIARGAWGSKHAELFDTGRVTFRVQDFFEEHHPFEVPGVGTVQAPDVYLTRFITHNWPDKDVKRMLSALRRTAAPHTKLFIIENLLPYACIDNHADHSDASQGGGRSLAPEGSPLLPNLGKASSYGYILDTTMFGLFDAKERTYREMDELTRSAGWKITNVKRAAGTLWAYSTAVPV